VGGGGDCGDGAARAAPGGWRRAVAIIGVAVADLVSALAAMIPLVLLFGIGKQAAIDWFGTPWPDIMDPDERDFAWAMLFYSLIGLALALLPGTVASLASRRCARARPRWLVAGALAALVAPWLFWLVLPQAAGDIMGWIRHL
jgi:hypothetical protein